MGSADFDITGKRLLIHSHIVTYGNAANEEITRLIREEIEQMWNEPVVHVAFGDHILQLRFRITAAFTPGLQPLDVFSNTDPRNNYFRIEPSVQGNISFVDGVGSNTGYFLLENLYAGSTTAAHEYGHTIGLAHPEDMDLRGQGVPGIMYPRGTLVDPPYQYNPQARSGDNTNGGTMHPRQRRVLPQDIAHLKLHRLRPGSAQLGEFTSVWHPDHGDLQG